MFIHARIRYAIYFIIPLILLTFLPALSLADAERIFKENSKAVVVVIAYDKQGKPISQGSGFIVRPDGAVVTNYHVISNARDIKIKVGDKALDVEGLIHTDKENDIVILKAKGKSLPTVSLGDFEKTNIGEKVYVISSPEGLENTISDGILSGIREIDLKRKILQITAPVSRGSNGGPVFNKNGKVIGIATFIIEESQNLNFAMPLNLIKDKITTKKVIALKDPEIGDYKESAEYWFVLGYYYGERGMYKEAVEAFKQAIRIKPDFADAHNNLGVIYLILNDKGSALDEYKILKELNPELANELFNLNK
ncbi:MAG: trypsin-like peptidase domain-containing protein [Nitrospirae bacterium]|nr:trypsin-like peptidase domain-containing protein [Nitrospirota bacterium]